MTRRARPIEIENDLGFKRLRIRREIRSQRLGKPRPCQTWSWIIAALVVGVLSSLPLRAADEPAIPSAGPGVIGEPAKAAEPEEAKPKEEEPGLGVGRDTPDYQRPIDRRARLIKVEPAQYPDEIAGSGLAADVQLSVVVDRTGRASHIRVEDSPDELFTEAALDAIAQWEWQPALKRGKLTNERIPISVQVSEEHGDLAVFDFKGGRVALEDVRYAAEVDTPIHRRFGVRPVYPFPMLAIAKPGEVLVDFLIGESGIPKELEVVETTHREFGYAALGAFVHWKFEPAQFHGRIIPARLRYRVSFQPQEFDEETMRMAVGLRDGNLPELVSVRDIDRQPRAAKVYYPPSTMGDEDIPKRHKVNVSLLVTPKGEPLFPQVDAAPDPVSGYAAVAALQYWRFTPAIQKRQPVLVHLRFPMTF